MASLFHLFGFHAIWEFVEKMFKEVGTTEVKDAVKRRQTENFRDALEKVLAYLDRLTLSVLTTFMDTHPASAYPRLYVKTGVDGKIGHVAKIILDERYRKFYKGKAHENDFATGLGRGIGQDADGINIEGAVKQLLYYANLDEKEFRLAMDRLKHDPFMGPARVYGEAAAEKATEAWEYIQDEYPDIEKYAVKKIKAARKSIQRRINGSQERFWDPNPSRGKWLKSAVFAGRLTRWSIWRARKCLGIR